MLKIQLPQFLNTSIKNMGVCTTALSMLIVGMILADVKITHIFNKNSFYAAFVRLILVPVIVLVIMNLLKLDEVIKSTAVIMTGMPFGSTTALLAQKYGADAEFASECVFLTTLLSLITMPVISIFL